MSLVHSFFETAGQGAFSLANLSLVLMNAQTSSDAVASGTETEDMRLDQWMNKTAYFHELRHYHDLLGSTAGLHVFLETTQAVDQVCKILHDDERPIVVPVLSQNPGSKAAHYYIAYRKFLQMALGDTPISITEGGTESTSYPVESFTSAIPKVTTDYPLVPIPRPNPLSGVVEEQLVPVGLRALLEYTATEVQFFFATIGAGEDPNATTDLRDRGRRYLKLCTKLVRGQFLPYMVVRLFATYHHFRPSSLTTEAVVQATPPLGSLMPLVQLALDISGYVPISERRLSHRWEFEHPGLAFAHVLSAWSDEDRHVDGVVLADRVAQQFVAQTYRDFIARYVDQMSRRIDSLIPQHLSPSSANMELIGSIRRDVLDDHLGLMGSKITDLRLWFEPIKYVEGLNSLPMPPLHVVPGVNVGVDPEGKGGRFLVWTFLLAFVEGVMETGVVRCPVMEGMAPLGEKINFSDHRTVGTETNCVPFIEGQLCGRFAGTFSPTQPPHCPFARTIERFIEMLGTQLDFGEG